VNRQRIAKTTFIFADANTTGTK